MLTSPLLVFDCESIGFYGETFAVGAVVIDNNKGSDFYGRVIDSIYLGCPESHAGGDAGDRQWILENVVPHLPEPNCANAEEVRDRFWVFLQYWQEMEASVWADCGVPVEANFLRLCVFLSENRKWKAPYPLHEIATAFLLSGIDPTGIFDRLPDEIPAHNPLNDARQSARLLFEVLNRNKASLINRS